MPRRPIKEQAKMACADSNPGNMVNRGNIESLAEVTTVATAAGEELARSHEGGEASAMRPKRNLMEEVNSPSLSR